MVPKTTPRKERNLVPPPKTDCVQKKSEKYGHYKTKRSQLIASEPCVVVVCSVQNSITRKQDIFCRLQSLESHFCDSLLFDDSEPTA